MQRFGSKDGISEIIRKDGSKGYVARVHRRGVSEKYKTFGTRAEAVKWKKGIDADVDRDIPVLDRKKILISKIINDYLYYRANSLTPLAANQITEYERVRIDLGTLAINKLDSMDLENWIKLLLTEGRGTYKNGKVKGPYALASVRKFYYALKSAADWHSKKFKYHIDEYLFKLQKGSVPAAWDGKRERRLAAGEEERLYAAGIDRKDTYTRADWSAIIGFALETALREQELVFARWQDLRQEGFKLFVPKEHSKTKKDRYVLLSGIARGIVKAQRALCPEDEHRIFFQAPNPESICDAFARLTKRAKIVDLHFHDLRHEAVSRLCEGGVLNMMQIMEMTDHSSLTTFRGYLHLLKESTSVVLP